MYGLIYILFLFCEEMMICLLVILRQRWFYRGYLIKNDFFQLQHWMEVIANRSDPNSSNDSFSPQGGVYAMYCEYKNNIVRKPVILYQFTNPLNIDSISCRINYSGIGHICLLSSITTNTNSNPTPFFIKINFLSQGSLFNVALANLANLTSPTLDILPLRFGGYFYFALNYTDTASFIWGYVLDDNGNLHNWTFNYPTELNYYGIRQVLTNNTVVMAQPTKNQTWGLISTDLYRVYDPGKVIAKIFRKKFFFLFNFLKF